MTVLGALALSLVYCSVLHICILEGDMNAAAVGIAILVILMAVNVICNINGINLDAVPVGVVSAIAGMWIYQGLIKLEKKKDDQE